MTPGLVGVIAQETSRYSMFSASLTSLKLPEGTAIKWWFGMEIADNCNALVREMYQQEKEWLWLLGDDHSFSPPILERLLAHDADIVVPLCLMRYPPYRPVIYSGLTDAGKRRDVDLDDHPAGGLIPVHSAGSGGMLIRRRVFDALEDPWFRAYQDDATKLSEDLYFCDQAREAGFDIYCDLDTNLGHLFAGVVWPVRNPDGWTFAFSMMGGFQVTMPRGAQAYADEVGRQ